MAACRLIALHINKGKLSLSVWQIERTIHRMQRKPTVANISAPTSVTLRLPIRNSFSPNASICR